MSALALAVWLAAVPVPDVTAASTADVGARLAAVTRLLDAEADAAALWTWGWVELYGALTVGQLVVVPHVDADTRIDLWVGVVSSLLGAVLQGAVQLNLPTSAGLPAEPSAALAEALRRAEAGAKREALFSGWLAHAANVVVNAAIALVQGLAFQHWVSAGISFGVGLAVGEVVVLTQPTQLRDAARQGSWPLGR